MSHNYMHEIKLAQLKHYGLIFENIIKEKIGRKQPVQSVIAFLGLNYYL